MSIGNKRICTLGQTDDVSLHRVRTERLQHLHLQWQVHLLDQCIQCLCAASQAEVVPLRGDYDHRLGSGDLINHGDEGADRRWSVYGVTSEDYIHLRFGDHACRLTPIRANEFGSNGKEELNVYLLTASTPQFTTMVGRVAFSRESSL